MSNARIQQALGVAGLCLLLGWGWYCVSRSWWAGLLLLLPVAVPQAPVLALELVWAALAARRDAARRPLGARPGTPEHVPEPFPPPRTWLWALVQEVGTSFETFGWRQPWAHDRWPDFIPQDARGRRAVLLVHGFVCNRGFWNPWMKRLRLAGVPYGAVSMGPPFGDIAVQAQAIQAAWRELTQATGVPPLLVGHSMGGLALRAWLSTLPEDMALAHEVITIGSPHHGTALAALARSEAALQMQVLSPFLRDLATSESPARRARFTCYWSVCDNIVFPANTATLPGARSVAIGGRAHVALAHDPAVLADVLGRTQGVPMAGASRPAAPASPL